MALLIFLLAALQSITMTSAQPNLPGLSLPLAERCGPSSANFVCVNRYASVLPYPFFRNPKGNSDDTLAWQASFPETSVSNGTNFNLLQGAEFLVFDNRAFEILGPNPTYDLVFNVTSDIHEAPVYVPLLNKLFLSQFSSDKSLLVVDLGQNPPTLSNYSTDPPVYWPNGGTLYNGLIYWAVGGGSNSADGIQQRGGIVTLDPLTNETVTLLNNYYGWYFNGADDIFVDPIDGSVWFTDPQYGWFGNETDTPPQLKSASYRFDQATGEVRVVDYSLVQPNGIALSPDGKHVYISDTGADGGTISPEVYPPVLWLNQTDARVVYKFDRVDGGKSITNKRPIWYAQDGIPDGLKVAADGHVLTATAQGVDVLDPNGSLLVRIQTSFTVQNFAWAGENLTELWLVGQGGIARVRWNLKGQDLARAANFTGS